MKKLILLFSILCISISFNAEAQNCNAGKKLAKETWKAWAKPYNMKISLVPFKNEVRLLRNSWNTIASNSGSTVGPRFLDTDGSKEVGSIAGQTRRTFVTPPSFNSTLTITVNKYDGKAETGVIICSHGQDGITTTLKEYTFPKDKNGKIKKFVLNNVKGKIISVAMRNKSVANKFKYRVTAQ